MTHPTLYRSSEDNKLHVFDMPDNKPLRLSGSQMANDSEYSRYVIEMATYEKSLESAIANKVLVKYEKEARIILKHQLGDAHAEIKKDTPYPIDGYSVTIKYQDPKGDLHDFPYGGETKVAILTPVKEEKQSMRNCMRCSGLGKEMSHTGFEANCTSCGGTGKVVNRAFKPVESADNVTAFKEDLLNRFGSYLKEGSLDLRNNLSIQMDIYADLKYKKILDLKHSVNVDLKLKIEELENKLKAVDEPTEGKGGWIKLKDLQPETEEPMLVSILWKDGKTRSTGISMFSQDLGRFHHFNYDRITHWQPLPDTR